MTEDSETIQNARWREEAITEDSETIQNVNMDH
jgi:hypothetical protein